MRWLALIAVVVCGPCGAAKAWSFAPSGVPFTISGEMSFSGGGMSVDCKVIIAGATDSAGMGQITAATFMGGALGICGGIHPLNLPWTVKAVDGRDASISSIAVRAPLFGDCAAHDVPAIVTKAGAVQIGHVDLPPRCKINGGELKSVPKVSIAP